MKTFKLNNPYLMVILITSVFISLSGCNHKTASESRSIPDDFKQNERLGRGGNLGNILYEFETWDKEREMKEMDMIKEIDGPEHKEVKPIDAMSAKLEDKKP